MSADRALSRRDFLRLRRTERGVLVEVSCRALFMRVADAGLTSDSDDACEPWMGEPPAQLERRSVTDVLGAFARELDGATVVRLRDPEWLANMPHAAHVRAVLDAFRARGGVIEPVHA